MHVSKWLSSLALSAFFGPAAGDVYGAEPVEPASAFPNVPQAVIPVAARSGPARPPVRTLPGLAVVPSSKAAGKEWMPDRALFNSAVGLATSEPVEINWRVIENLKRWLLPPVASNAVILQMGHTAPSKSIPEAMAPAIIDPGQARWVIVPDEKTQVVAFGGRGPRSMPVMPPSNCPPPTTQPKTPEAKKSTDPNAPADPNMPPAGPDQLAGATEAGTQPGAMFNSYMFGDRFGGGRTTTTARVGSLVGQAFLTNNGASSTIVTLTNSSSVFNIPVTNSTIVAANGSKPNFTFPVSLPAVATSPTPISTTVTSTVTGTQAQPILFPIPGASFTGGGIPLQNNVTFQQFIDSVFKSQFGTNGQTVFQSASLSAGAGTTGAPSTQPGTAYQFNFSPDSQVYFAYDYFTAFSLPLPSSGGVVGTTKISENNSPMPRDRAIFDYDYFSNVPLTTGGFNVSRFSPGFEKTFLNRRASFELRLPFASTVDNSSIADGLTNRATVFGNLNMTFKALFYASETFNFSTGMGVALPTAPDTRVRLDSGADLVRIKNQTVLITPFLAGVYTPTERFYAQAWAQVGFDASGSPVYANPNLTGLIGAGRLYDQTLLQLDAQFGYWLVRDSGGSRFVTGLAPFVELHYNTPINDASIVTAGSFAIGSSSNRYDEFNIATGINTVLRNRMNLILGVVLPLGQGDGKFFDIQFGVRANWIFGARNPRTDFVSNY